MNQTMVADTKVVVTGYGAVSPVGHSMSSTWENIKAGTSGGGPLTRFDTTEFKTKIACEVTDFDPCDYMDKREARRNDRFSQYLIVAAQEAMGHAKLVTGDFDPDRAAVIMGIGIGGFDSTGESMDVIRTRSPLRVHPVTIPKLISNMGAARIAIAYQMYGPAYAVTTACSSSADSITQAAQYIRSGAMDVVVAGGSEAPITPLGVAGFDALQALSSTFNDRPKIASRPFDATRNGFVIGEGAAVLILESEAHARKRGAAILAEVAGVASTNDAFHTTAPHPVGKGIIKAMRMALKDAGITPDRIDYINAHGTSTKMNDRIETAALKEVFGDYAYKVKVSSTKSMHGHMIGATGAMEVLICIKAIEDGFVPPTINYEHPDPECDLDYTPNVGVPHEITYALSSSLGFGGHNGVIIVRRA